MPEKIINKDSQALKRDLTNNTLTLLSFIKFLKKEKKLKKFGSFVYFELLNPNFLAKEYEIFYSVLLKIIKSPIDKIPNLEKLQFMIIKDGGNKELFTTKFLKKLLKNIINQTEKTGVPTPITN